MKSIFSFILLIIFTINSYSQVVWNNNNYKVPDEPVKELQFIAYFINQNVLSNFYAGNDLLKGQIVGRLFSANTTTTGKETYYFEQRLIPFFIYQPKLLGGKALLRASFEIDWTWGDAAYGVGGNFGSAFSADQVNIQTQNVALELMPARGWAINLGLQRLFDTPYNPYRTFVSTMLNTGYRLMYWGSDGVGVSVRKDMDYSRIKGGYYQLYENNVEQKDDVSLWELIYERDITTNWRQGLSLWYVYDRGNGEGGVSILGQGLKSLLNNYNGVYKFNELDGKYKADIYWLGTYANYNPEFKLGRLSLNAFGVANFGTVKTEQDDGKYEKAVDISGIGANFRAGYRYGQTADDAVTIDVLYSTGDDDAANIENPELRDDKYKGVITGNTWSSPGALNINTGAYILYPHGNVVNRYISAISDLSNMGYGQLGGTINISKSFIPNKLSAKIGGGTAMSNVDPIDGGSSIGTELNAKISYRPAVFMNVEFHAAYLWLGDFFDSPFTNGKKEERPDNPYTLFVVFKWLMF